MGKFFAFMLGWMTMWMLTSVFVSHSVDPKDVKNLEHGWSFSGHYVAYNQVKHAVHPSGQYNFNYNRGTDHAWVSEKEGSVYDFEKIVDETGKQFALSNGVMVDKNTAETVTAQLDHVSRSISLPQRAWKYDPSESLSSGHLVEWVAK